MAIAAAQLLRLSQPATPLQTSVPTQSALVTTTGSLAVLRSSRPCTFFGHHRISKGPLRASPNASGNSRSVASDGEDGVSLGTLKLSPSTDLALFDALLFQWANSLCQGANLPLPVPLKVEKVKGGTRLGFARIGADGEAETPVYIDCLVFPADGPGTGPIFRAIRNGPLKEQPPPGEPRIMRSLLAALQKSVEVART